MVMPIRYSVGQQVRLTAASFLRARDQSRSIKFYPSEACLEALKPLVGQVGVVTHTFEPRYEVTVSFYGKPFHMRDDWVEPHEGENTWLDIEAEKQALHYGLSVPAHASLMRGAALHQEHIEAGREEEQ